MALQTIPSSGPGSAGAGTRDLINAAIRTLNDLVTHGTDIAAQILAIQASQGADEGVIAALQMSVVRTLAALGDPNDLPRLLARRFDFLDPAARPGDNPSGFVVVPSRAMLSGDGRTIAEIPAGVVASGDSGRAVRLTGTAVVSQRRPVPIEQARVYRARYVAQRRANPSDPSNDSVVLGIVWLDAGLNVIAPTNDVTIVEDMRDLTVALGRQERAVVFSRSPIPDAQFRAPQRARYARAYVQSYGLDGITDIEVLGIEDVSLATILAPETADTVQRVGALESENAGERLAALEADAGSPNSITFATKSDAASGQIPNTVTTVAIRGISSAGDGGDGLYARISGAAPPGSDSFVNHGVTFTRVFMTPDVLGALFLNQPTSLPPVAGRAWLNGGLPAVS